MFSEKFHSQIQGIYPTWLLFIHTLYSSSGDAIISYFSSLYLLPQITIRVALPNFFYSVISIYFHLVISFFNTSSFGLFTSTTISSSPSEELIRDFIHPQFSLFVQNDNKLIFVVNNITVNLSVFVPEPLLNYNSSIFDGWFSILFKNSFNTTHICAPHPLEIITLYNLFFYHYVIPFITFIKTCSVSRFTYPSFLPL